MSTLKKFIDPFRVEKNSVFTHTSFSKSLTGNFYIPGSEEDAFMQLYATCVENGEDLSFTEKHRDESCILIDLDFRQPTTDRLYTDEMVLGFLHLLKEQIQEFVEVTEEQLKFYVLEKPDARKNKGGGFKDGIHIVCPFVITKPDVQYLMRKHILDDGLSAVFGDTFANSYDDIYDEAVIEKNNWLLYGSKKPDEDFPWTLSKIYDANFQEIDNTHTDAELIEVLSIRNKFDKATVKSNKIDEIAIFKECHKKPSVEAPSPTASSSFIPSDLETILQLVRLLNPQRADKYHPWIHCGMCLRNIDDRLLGSWISFSKQSSKFIDGECERLWRSFTPKASGLKEGSLRYWAKKDNPTGYKNLMQDNASKLIFNSRAAAHTDIAKVVHYLFKDEYRCCFLNDKPFWYEFKDHRWVECPDAVSLKQKISNEVSRMYSSAYASLSAKAVNIEDEVEQANGKENAKMLGKIAYFLKLAPFKANIIKECRELFVVTKKDFYEKLDENKSLIGFDNGVYDLEACYFRDGLPDDFLTYSVGYDYTDIIDEEKASTLKKILADIFTEDVLPYILNTGSYALDGNKNMEFMQFWIGTGANGKGLLSILFINVLGEYCYCPDVSIFTTKKTSSSTANPELAKMKGKRLAIATEPNEDDKFQVGQLKSWTGGDKIQARQLYKDNVEFAAQFLIIIQMNHKPALSDFDGGIARRLKNVEFPHKFVETPQLPHERQGDLGLKKRIEQDVGYAQQFMLMLLENYRNNIAGGRKFETPARVEQYTKEYLDANNKVGAFLAESCEVTNNDNDIILTKDLFDIFKTSDFYEGKGKDNFVEHMGQCGFKSTKHKKKGQFRDKYVLYGLKVKDGYGFVDDDEYEC
jgi:P4 family phage/plasmid primase-like protien